MESRTPNVFFPFQVVNGVDIESVDRFRKIGLDSLTNGFRDVFKKEEIEYCIHKVDPFPCFTARFAAKEAVIKALSSAGQKGIKLDQIEIIRAIDGTPSVRFISNETYNYLFNISISHTTEYAIAFCIIYAFPENSQKKL